MKNKTELKTLQPGDDYDTTREKAIKWFTYGMKKRKNLVKMYLDFFNIKEGDLQDG